MNNYSIIPCLEEFTLDDQNVCDQCQIKIQSENELSQQKSSSGRTCAKLPLSFLNTKYLLDPLRVFGFAVILVFGTSLFTFKTQAQTTNPQTLIDNPYFTITGKVVDENGEGVGFTHIYIPRGTFPPYGVQTDIDGNFTLNYPRSLIEGNKVYIHFKNVGYENDSIKLKRKQLSKDEINLGEITLSEVELEPFIIGKVENHISPSNKEMD